jgi:hypothetical protein
MKNIIKTTIFAFILFASALVAKAQTPPATVTLPSASSTQVNLAWQNSSGCNTSTPCEVIPYRIGGTCPATLAGTTGWTQLPTTTAQAVAVSDTTVAPGQEYSYVVEEVYVAGGANSAPSNCVTVNVPNVPNAATGLTATGT